MELKRIMSSSKALANIVDFASVYMLTWGIAGAYMETSFWEISWAWLGIMSLVLTAVLFAVSVRLWIFPVVAGIGLIAGWIYLKAFDRADAFWEYARLFIMWARSGAPENEYFTQTGGVLLLQCLIIFAITLVMFIIVARIFSFAVVLLTVSAFFISMHMLRDVDLSVPILLVSAGMIILIPRIYSLNIKRSGKPVSRGHMQIIAVPIAIGIVIISGFIIPKDTSGWKSQIINYIAADISNALGNPFDARPAYRSNFRLSTLGFSEDEARLGGPAQLSEDLLLRVDAPRALLLKGAVYDRYTGHGWQVGQYDGDFRYRGLFMDSYRNEAFDRREYATQEMREVYDSLTDRVGVSIIYEKTRYTAAFTSGRLYGFSFSDDSINRATFFNMRSELYTHERIEARTELEVVADVWKNRDDAFGERFRWFERLAAAQTDKRMEGITQRYTALPENLPIGIYELTDNIISDVQTPYEKASAIEKWLGENCEYTLSPPVPPANMDFTEHFLDIKKGYCTYFATAMTVMARCAGIPSRYVTGFGIRREIQQAGMEQEIPYAYSATGETGHAWSELYFYGIGWVEFDPLRWNTERPVNQEIQEDGEEQISEPTPAPIITPEPEEGDVHEETIVEDESALLWIIMSAIAAFLCSIILFVCYRRILKRKIRQFDIDRMRKNFPQQSMEIYFKDILVQLRILGIWSRPGETLTEFAPRVDNHISSPIKFTEIARVQMRLEFAEIEPSEDEIILAYNYHSHLERLIMDSLGSWKYFFIRAIRDQKSNR